MQLRRTGTTQRVPPPGAQEVEVRGAAVADAFAQDGVVADRKRTPSPQWERARLAIVVGLCGNSVAAESRFLHAGIPIAVVVDPAAAQAALFSQIVRDAGDVLFVQAGEPPSSARLAQLHRNLGAFDGIASRDTAGMAAALRGTALSFFDERGDSVDDDEFTAANVPLIQRDLTADDRASTGYAAFMLGRAAALSRRIGQVVVLVRPLPSTLQALRAFAASGDAQMVALGER